MADTLLPLDDRVLQAHGIPIKAKTFRKWRTARQFPELFVKIGGRVFLSLEEWGKLVARSKCDLARPRPGRRNRR